MTLPLAITMGDAAGIEEVTIRTIMTCHAEHGVCQKCYGWDLATARPVNTPVFAANREL